ncbi:hypothetical protein GALMADRAFT_262367 [Galerina marginata CBS 339.88]|uniref:RING-type domain-containing protein n=1 Tax=Galerina marginata (strain CBS 339.88) TaxID=685588 RepID=A0A067TLD0_GALM3|nr:hypothetical protein GALMADRAFT_262367 [Galerina marginata CBS 339.88]
MPLTITLKGKKRAVESTPPEALPSTPSGSEPPHPTKRARRAETRQCPVCEEHIPLRLLAMHAQLESERVEEVIKKVGSSDVAYDEMIDESLPGPSSRVRRSAMKARKSMTTRNVKDSLDQSTKTIQIVKRRRKQRNLKLKEMLKEEEEGNTSTYAWLKRFTGEEITCPVCSATVRGDRDVLDAHVDSCLAHESQRLQEACQRELLHQRALEEEAWDDAEDNNYVGDVRGAGFYTRRDDDEYVDEEVDIDGDDQVIFGETQFTEGDVVPVNLGQEEVDEDFEVEIEGDDDDEAQQAQRTLRDLIAPGKAGKQVLQNGEVGRHGVDLTSFCEMDKLDFTILSTRQRGDKSALLLALENKIKLLESAPSTSLLCRICIDPYTEPTVSTGCWHTCCKECWLRCLGSTKLCPICKRITGASDLRRVYL